MRLKLICCDVFLRIACDIVAKSPHVIDVEFVPMLAHTIPDMLRKDLQERIDKSCRAKRYDKIILAYGLCGNATVGLQSNVPLIMPRMHDCCTMFMDSKERYLSEFGNSLSMRWCTCGYYERCNLEENEYYKKISEEGGDISLKQYAVHTTTAEYRDLAEKYGEDNAEYIWETMHPNIETDEAAYIEIEGFEYSGSYEGYKNDVESHGKTLKLLKGGTSFLTSLINGDNGIWDNSRFLEVIPGQTVTGVYDMDVVITAT